MQPVVC